MRLRTPIAVALAALAVTAPTAAAGSLPRVNSGAPPGPPLLYERPPSVPELSVRAPFRARPLLVSGTDAYRGGEYVYQDYLFDDRGADTVPGSGNQRDEEASFSPTAGDVFYPTAARYAQNAADLVEFRVRPNARELVYRVTLNTVKAADATIVGIGIDRDRSGGAAVAWPGGAGISSPGLDAFVTAWGTGGRVYARRGSDAGLTLVGSLPRGAVSIDPRTNQMVVRVARSFEGMNPGRNATWRYVAGAGVRDGTGFREVPPRGEPTEERGASGNPLRDAPEVYNLAFRFDEPQDDEQTPQYGTFPGVGNWYEDKQADALAARTSGDFHADVSFAALRSGTSRWIHRPRRDQARIFGSNSSPHEGFDEGFPEYGGRLQPYFLRVPPGYRRGQARGLTWALHSLGGTYTQYRVFAPKQRIQFGDQRGDFYVTTLGRGPDGWYQGHAERDFFEVWRDVAHRFTLDPRQVALSGYSMGGYGTYRFGTFFPDLFGRAYTTVGPPAEGIWLPVRPSRDAPGSDPPPTGGQVTNSNVVLENARWLPYMNWVASSDQLVPYVGPRRQQNDFDQLGLRSTLWTFAPADHFTLSIRDEWGPARDFLGRARVKRAPSRVNYAFMPESDERSLGIRHDHAYWLSRLRARDARGNPRSAPARAEIDSYSLAFGEAREPETAPVAGAFVLPPAATIDGLRWTGIPRTARANELRTSLANIRTATIDGRRSRLTLSRRLRLVFTSDGPSHVRLVLGHRRPLVVQIHRSGSARTAAVRTAGHRTAARAAVDRRGITFSVPRGRTVFIIRPAAAAPRFTG